MGQNLTFSGWLQHITRYERCKRLFASEGIFRACFHQLVLIDEAAPRKGLKMSCTICGYDSYVCRCYKMYEQTKVFDYYSINKSRQLIWLPKI